MVQQYADKDSQNHFMQSFFNVCVHVHASMSKITNSISGKKKQYLKLFVSFDTPNRVWSVVKNETEVFIAITFSSPTR